MRRVHGSWMIFSMATPNEFPQFAPRYALGHFGQDFLLQVRMGMIPGFSIINKFGENEQITTASDPEDIWETGGIYNYDEPGTAPIVSLVSDSISDTEDIRIEGLDINGNEVVQVVKLSGTTRVALTTPLYRVYRMRNLGGVSLVGTVYCYVGVGGVPSAANTRATITPGKNQTLMALYTIPAGKVGFQFHFDVGINYEGSLFAGTESVRLYLSTQELNQVFRVRKSISLISSGNTTYEDDAIRILPPLTDIKLTGVQVSAEMGLWGAFKILLVDEELFSSEFIAAASLLA